jgi:hypothetical protein
MCPAESPAAGLDYTRQPGWRDWSRRAISNEEAVRRGLRKARRWAPAIIAAVLAVGGALVWLTVASVAALLSAVL